MDSSSFSFFSWDASDLDAGFSVRTPNWWALTEFALRRRESRFFCVPHVDEEAEQAHHFLDACFLCKRPLTKNCDIFMYRGDTPFCSEECREVQIEKDELQEKNSTYALRASSRKAEQQQKQKQKPRCQRFPVRAW